MKTILENITNWFDKKNLEKETNRDHVAKMDVSDLLDLNLIDYDFEHETENENINYVYVTVDMDAIDFYYKIGYFDKRTDIVTLKSDMVGRTDGVDISFKFCGLDTNGLYHEMIELFINKNHV